ncbi:prefoldin subunit alpha [Candidatus Woesearchaeota archaeon]|nr:prefoldin subunit alpha [Candidatus Woesearchaeota archaeon]
MERHVQEKQDLTTLRVEVELLKQQLKDLEVYLQSLDDRLQDLRVMVSALEEFSKVKTPANALIPLVSGVFVDGEIKNLEKVKVNVGAGVVVEKSLPEAIDLLNKQILDLTAHRDDVVREFEKGVKALQEREQELYSYL